jgi:hypothetical protein
MSGTATAPTIEEECDFTLERIRELALGVEKSMNRMGVEIDELRRIIKEAA